MSRFLVDVVLSLTEAGFGARSLAPALHLYVKPYLRAELLEHDGGIHNLVPAYVATMMLGYLMSGEP